MLIKFYFRSTGTRNLKARVSIHANALTLTLALAPAKRVRTNALGLRESTRCVRDFCEQVQATHTQLAIICERARNADSRTFETHYICSFHNFLAI